MFSKIHIAIEGAVAVGKSTLLPKLHAVFLKNGINLDLVLEPVDKWVNWEGPNSESWNLLELMYQNTEKYALPPDRFCCVRSTDCHYLSPFL